MYRDFSAKSKQNMLNLVSQVENEKWSDFTDWVGDRWLDFQDWIGKLNIKNYINNVNKYHKLVFDKNNTSKKTINDIFSTVNSIDAKYQNNFSCIRESLEMLRRIIEEMSIIVNPQNGQFTTDYMKGSLSGLLDEYFNFLDSHEYLYYELNQKSTKQPQEKIELPSEKIISDVDYTRDFLDGRSQGFDIFSIAWGSNWLKNFLSLFGIGENSNEAAVRKSIESLIRETIENKHKGSDFYDDYTTKLTPDEFNKFKALLNFIASTGEKLSEMEIAEYLGISEKEVADSPLLKYLSKEYTFPLEFYSKMGDILDSTLNAWGDAVETIDVLSQWIGRLVNDYSEDLKLLENIRTAMIDSGYDQKVVMETIDRIMDRYNNQLLSVLEDGKNMLIEKGVEEISKDALPLLSLFLSVKDFGVEISGLSGQVENLEMIYTTQQYSYALIDKYEFYAEKIRSGSYTQEDINQCKTYFNLARNAKIQEYEAIINLYESALQAADSNNIMNMDTGEIRYTGGLMSNGIYSFVSEEDKQAVRSMIEKLNNEICRLKKMSFTPNDSESYSNIQSFGGVMGAR